MKKSAHNTLKLADLIPDKRNANKGTPRGSQMVEDSLRNYGAGRSILVDKNLRIIAGNKTVENAGAIGLDDVIIIQTDGSKLVAVQRTDLDLDTDKMAKELAIADNRSGEVSLDWNADVLAGLVDEIDLGQFFTTDELAGILTEDAALKPEIDVPGIEIECTCPRCGFAHGVNQHGASPA